jgi:hypothetical protein
MVKAATVDVIAAAEAKELPPHEVKGYPVTYMCPIQRGEFSVKSTPVSAVP